MTLYFPNGVDAVTMEKTRRFFYFAHSWTITTEMRKELIALAPDICLKARNDKGDTPMKCALIFNHPALVEALLKAGDDIETRDEGGDTLLMVAAYRGYKWMVRTLIKAGADIEARDNHGITSLMKAGINNKADIINEFLEKGANIYAKHVWGKTLLKEDRTVGQTFLGVIAPWQQQYESFVKDHTPPQSAADVYHLLAVYPLIDPKAPVDRETHLRQIFSYAKWPDKERPREIIKQLREDGTVSAALAESLLALTQPARKSILENHGRGR